MKMEKNYIYLHFVSCVIWNVVLIALTAAEYPDVVCQGDDNEKSKPYAIPVNDQNGKQIAAKTVQVRFQCLYEDVKFALIMFCYPEDHTEKNWHHDSAEVFKAKDGNWYKLHCAETGQPTVSDYFAREVCQKANRATKISVNEPLSDPKEVDVTFDCNAEKTKITMCYLSGADKSKGIVASMEPGLAGGMSGEKYSIQCSPLDKPIVTEKFFPEVCHSKAIATPTPQSKTSTNLVTIRCNAKADAVEWCTPGPEKGKTGVKAGGRCDIKTFRKSTTYTLKCKTDTKPEIYWDGVAHYPAC